MAAPPRIVVVGAGLAGLACARRLVDEGMDVTVVERDVDVGGRLRTVEVAGAVCDAGAQFFTVRSPAFRAAVDGWIADGLVAEWCQGFTPEGDGFARYRVTGGMQELGRALAGPLEIVCATAVQGVAPLGDGRWRIALAGEGREPWQADAVVLTPPLPLAARLVPAELRAAVPELEWNSTAALLVALFDDPAVPEPGGLQLAEGPISFVADSRRKGISAQPGLTLHGSPAWTWAHREHPAEAVERELLAAASAWVGDVPVVATELRRWRHAGPRTSAGDGCLVLAPGLVLAGDAFNGAKVEGAWRSGAAAAEVIVTGGW